MEAILELLQRNALFTATEIADRLDLTEDQVRAEIKELENKGAILGYHAVVDEEKVNNDKVTAIIEIKLTPERQGGFDQHAIRIAKFDQVTSCYLMSGGYDLTVIVEGNNLKEVAQFVSEKLSTIEGVVSTSTHFQLKVYKQSGFLASECSEDQRPPVS